MMEKMKIFNFCFFNFLSLSREYYVEGVSAPLPCGSCALICAPGCGAGGLCLLSPLQRGDAQQGAEPEPTQRPQQCDALRSAQRTQYCTYSQSEQRAGAAENNRRDRPPD